MGHDHGHEPADHGRAFLIGISLNLTFVVVEVIFGVLSHSMSLVADAGHNLTDVLGLGLAWGASLLARRTPSERHTYGMKRASILAALANAVLLLVATGAVAWEAIRRIRSPGPVEGKTIIIVAGIGVAINALSAWLFARGREDLNIRSAFLHLVGDAVLALGVVITGAIILFSGWTLLDPIVSLLLAAAILATTWTLLRKSLALGLDAVPETVDLAGVRVYLESLPNVTAVHDLHVWPMSTTEAALTAHLVVCPYPTGGALVSEAAKALHDRFRIEHATIQIEDEKDEKCRLEPHGAKRP